MNCRRRYWIKYTKGFANTYRLCYTDTTEETALVKERGWDNIARKQAEAYARDERNRIINNKSFSGFADACICKYGYLSFNAYRGDIVKETEECEKDLYD